MATDRKSKFLGSRKPPSLEMVRRLLDYDPETGLLTWKRRRGNKLKVGDKAGNVSGAPSYVRVKIDGLNYLGHILAWALMFNEWRYLIDHHDGDGTNNKLSNLRAATKSLNHANQKMRRDNASGLKGVCWRKDLGRWQARIMKDNVRVSLGFFDTPEDAHAAYVAAATEKFGHFARGQ